MSKTLTILAVDDDMDFLEIISAKLESSQFEVHVAKDGNEAIAETKKLKPSLILMDVQMPKKDGIQATMEIKKDSEIKDIPIIFLTNLGDSWPSVAEVNRRFAQQVGANDYFKKGGDLDLLIGKIQEILKV